MNKSKPLVFGTLSVLAVAGALALAPVVVNAETAPVQNRGAGYGLRDGTGAGRQGNGQQASLESRAKVLNMTAEQLSEKLKTQTMLQIAQGQGLSEEQFQAKMREASSARWQERGLSSAEIQTRVQAQAERQENCDGSGDHQGQGGFGRGQRAQ